MEDPPLVKRQRPLRSVCLQVNDDPNTSYYVEGQSVTRCTFNIADCVKVPQTSGALRGYVLCRGEGSIALAHDMLGE